MMSRISGSVVRNRSRLFFLSFASFAALATLVELNAVPTSNTGRPAAASGRPGDTGRADVLAVGVDHESGGRLDPVGGDDLVGVAQRYGLGQPRQHAALRLRARR